MICIYLNECLIVPEDLLKKGRDTVFLEEIMNQ